MKICLLKNVAKISFLSLAAVWLSNNTFAQGCVAIRSTGNICTMDHLNGMNSKSWILNTNNRYFKSFRHFVGGVEQKQRVEEGTDVRNNSYTMDITLTRNFNSRFSASVAIPYNHNDRSSLYEHGGQGRHITSSTGIGDIRLSAYGMVFDPSKAAKGNIQLGLGVKLPTGQDDYKDNFYTSKGSIEGPVDQSIQLGDGGTGITAELNTNYTLSRRFNVYGNFFYLVNPRETNGVSTGRGGTASASTIAYTADVMSVPDQYMARAGANVTFNNIAFGLGLRDEGLPSHDLIGGSKGFRRPGFILSAEPGIIYKIGKINVYTYLPVALVRKRIQSYPDEIRSQMTHSFYNGDAAFSDYAVNAGISLKL